MAVNQAQVDHILSSASADDPEVKVQKLQEEVDLIKVSIKRLLIDIRERMNELENPFVHAISGNAMAADVREQTAAAREASAVARDAHVEKREAETVRPEDPGPQIPSPSVPGTSPTAPAGMIGISGLQDPLVEAIRAQLLDRANGITQQHEKIGHEKLRLTKVHRLFEWTSRMVKKYGHDRLEMMLQSYRAMGYLTSESCEQVKEISRLMPANLGESHEITPDEFIRELYALNRILDPSDTSLDRDMIGVLMEQRRQGPSNLASKSSVERGSQDEWVQMLDGA